MQASACRRILPQAPQKAKRLVAVGYFVSDSCLPVLKGRSGRCPGPQRAEWPFEPMKGFYAFSCAAGGKLPDI